MKRIDIYLKNRSCRVLLGNSSLSLFKEEIKKVNDYRNYFVVTDENVWKLHYSKIEEAFKENRKIFFYRLPPGENSKSHSELNKIYSALLKNGFGKDTLLIAVGGGVTGDISGFAASTFMRGIPYAQVPTTLLSMIDSSIGGKTGINFKGSKNIIGTIYQPELVITDPDFLVTLPEVEFNSGLCEAVKYAFLEGEELFCFMNDHFNEIRNSSQMPLYLIEKCIRLKAAVVEKDETEKGLRKILNLGHTFGHAIESSLKYNIKHGEAVVLGIAASLYLSRSLGFFTEALLEKYLFLPQKLTPSGLANNINISKTMKLMKADKKIQNNKEKFVLVQKPGNILVDVAADKTFVINALKRLRNI